MINKEKVKQLVLSGIENSDVVLVELQINAANQIKVFLDSINGVTINKCVEISRLVESNLDRDEEDFELEVSSYGISQPFILPLHYQKNVGREVEVFCEGEKSIKGILKNVELIDDNTIKTIEILCKKKIKLEGKKKKVEIEEIARVERSEIRKAKLVPIF